MLGPMTLTQPTCELFVHYVMLPTVVSDALAVPSMHPFLQKSYVICAVRGRFVSCPHAFDIICIMSARSWTCTYLAHRELASKLVVIVIVIIIVVIIIIIIVLIIINV